MKKSVSKSLFTAGSVVGGDGNVSPPEDGNYSEIIQSESSGVSSGSSNMISVIASSVTKSVKSLKSVGGGGVGVGVGVGVGRKGGAVGALSRNARKAAAKRRGFANIALSHVASAVLGLHARFVRNEEVDVATYDHFETVVVPSAPPPSAPESAFITNMLLHDSPLLRKQWRRMHIEAASSDPIEYFEKNGDGISSERWGKGVTKLDVSAARALSWLWFFMSNERIQRHNEEFTHRLKKEILVPNSSRSKLTLKMLTFKGFDDRVFPTVWTWRKEDNGTFTLAFGGLKECEGFGEAMHAAVAEAENVLKNHSDAVNAERASMIGFYRFKPLASNLCELTFVASYDFGGRIPTFIAGALVKSGLSVVERMQHKFSRNGVAVDREMRETFATPPTLEQLVADHPELAKEIRKCQDLEVDHSEDGEFVPVRSSSPFAKMWKKHAPPKRGERSAGVCKAVVAIDSSARDACAWYFNFCSRERVRESREEKNPARIIVDEATPHIVVAASVKKMPFPFSHREFVFRQVCMRDEEGGGFSIAVSPLSHAYKVDYGFDVKAVRATCNISIRFFPLNHAQCQVTMYLFMDAGGYIPVQLMDLKAASALGSVVDMRDVLQRDEEIDNIDLAQLARVMREEEQVHTLEENEVVNRVLAKFGSAREDQFETLECPDVHVKLSKFFVPGQSSMIGHATTVVDASLEDCAAFNSRIFMSRFSQKQEFELSGKRSYQRTEVVRNDHCSAIRGVYDTGVPGFKLREFVSLQIWKKIDENMLFVVTESADLPGEFPIIPQIIRGYVTILWKLIRLPPVGGVAQTRVIKFHQVDVKGAIPRSFVNAGLARNLQGAIHGREHFDRSLDVDSDSRARFLRAFIHSSDRYSLEEDRAVKMGMLHFKHFEETKKAKKLKMSTPSVEAKFWIEETDDHLWSNRRAWGWASAIVKASPESCLSFTWGVMDRCRAKAGEVDKSVDDAPNRHSQLVYVRRITPNVIGDRSFLSRMIWQRIDAGFVVVTTPEESERRRQGVNERGSRRHGIVGSAGKGIVRGLFPSAMKFTKISDNETRVQYAIHPDWGGARSSWLFNRYISSDLGLVTRIQQYFLELRTLEEYDGGDGKVLGLRLMHPGGTNNNKPWLAVNDIVAKHRGLAKFARKFPWLNTFLQEAVKGRMTFASSVSTKLECLSEAEAGTIARSLAPALRQRKTAAAGVYQWSRQNRSMIELFERHKWMEDLVLAIAQDVLETAPWGLVWRVGTGSCLSLLDMSTDIRVVVNFMSTPGQEGYGLLLLGFIVWNLVMQSVVSIAQNWQRKDYLLREILIIVTGMKPTADAYRVIRGNVQQDHQLIDAKMELVLSKGIELWTESIPGCIIQIYAALRIMQRGEELSGQVTASILISLLTTGFGSASMSYDFDTDPAKRRETPAFYGFIPDKGSTRTALFVCMTLNSALLLFVKSVSAAMLLTRSSRNFVLFWVIDMVVFFAYKAARNDFHHWLPIDGEVNGLVAAMLMRSGSKMLADFTGVIQLRASGEIGGIYWIANIALALGNSFVAAKIYFASFADQDLGIGEEEIANLNSTVYDGTEHEQDVALNESPVWLVLASTSVAWVFTFVVILLLMNRAYWRTFVSRETGNEWSQNFFLNGTSDKARSKTMMTGRKKWRSIEGDVSEWVLKNWWRWKDEKPGWFTENWIARVPDHFIPNDEDRRELKKVRNSVKLHNGARISLKGVVALSGSDAKATGNGPRSPVVKLGVRRKRGEARPGARVEAIA
jgi:hypothetical protein